MQNCLSLINLMSILLNFDFSLSRQTPINLSSPKARVSVIKPTVFR